MLKVNEMFCSIQGEGKFTGVPSFFVRTVGCNLRCVFSNSICDTSYTSFNPESPKYANWDELMDDFQHLMKKNPEVNHLVISGGEPLTQRKYVKEFIERANNVSGKNFIVTIETNGTLPAIMPWDDEDGNESWIDLWSVSPKLSTSVDWDCKFLTPEMRDHHNKIRINYDNLASYIDSMKEAHRIYDEDGGGDTGITPYCQFKFVYSGEDSVNEIKEIIKIFRYEYNIDLSDHIMLMPEGTNNEHLEKISQECAQVCIREGWKFCDRLHIRIWGDKRGV